MREVALLVGLDISSRRPVPDEISAEESLRELEALATSAGAEVAESQIQTRPKADAATYVGSGKLEELKTQIQFHDASVVVFDRELTPTQQRNLERALDVKILDRTQLILDIFARRARTREGQLQVELAQLNYMLPRLTVKGAAMSRLGGGIGTRGPGETKLETDRRRIHQRIHSIHRDLERVRGGRATQRRLRQAVPLATVALVGYTNAGKSTLFNRLTGAGVLADSKMFATLDPTVRHTTLPSRRRVLMSDTVGFIRDLPPDLMTAFRATLDELADAACETASRELNIGFFSRMQRGRPFVRLKSATSLDGRTALPDGRSQWITGAAARQDGHHWRARACAILTGIGTVRDDDPQLNVRDVDTPRQPLRVVIDSRLETPLPDVMRMIPNGPRILGEVAVDVRATADIDHGQFDASATVNGRELGILVEGSDGLTYRYSMGDQVHVEAHATQSGATFSHFSASYAGATVRSDTVSLNLTPTPTVEGAFQIRELDFTKLMADLAVTPRTKILWTLNAEARLHGTLSPLHLAVELGVPLLLLAAAWVLVAVVRARPWREGRSRRCPPPSNAGTGRCPGTRSRCSNGRPRRFLRCAAGGLTRYAAGCSFRSPRVPRR